MKKKVKKLVIYRKQDDDGTVCGCPECCQEVKYEDNFCRECGVEFEEEK